MKKLLHHHLGSIWGCMDKIKMNKEPDFIEEGIKALAKQRDDLIEENKQLRQSVTLLTRELEKMQCLVMSMADDFLNSQDVHKS